MSQKTIFTPDQAKTIGEQLGVSWTHFDVAQFRSSLGVELKHGTVSPKTDVTHDDPLLTGKIALAHLTEFPDYYTRLAKMESEAKRFWASMNIRNAGDSDMNPITTKDGTQIYYKDWGSGPPVVFITGGR